ncbi:MAG: phosphoribosylformylglycinamidine cyclo-ligase [Candidatus Cloacimonetes bacterium]|nr:phosphoribosylformylglycinamidine cyclo-ligase [Candidatus Cloacimonadota bacterium]
MDKLKSGISYRDSGVDIAAGEAAVKAIKNKVRTTYNSNVLSELGSFGGLYRIDKDKWRAPILVSSTDGVGTKLRIAIMAEKYDTIGQDLVNHCVNDILVQGAIPQFFLDYIGVGKLSPVMVEQVIDGLITACRENGCALIGGEMAEMPGIYHGNDFDLAGTIVGMVEENELLPRKSIAGGDLLVGLASSGLHTNGFSLVRKIIFEHLKLDLDAYIPECSAVLGDLLLAVHKSYLNVLKPFLGNPALHGLAHITGGGIGGNLSRILPDGIGARIQLPADSILPLYSWLQNAADISSEEMRRTFNMGIGMICIVQKGFAAEFISQTGGKYIGELSEITANQEKVVFA